MVFEMLNPYFGPQTERFLNRQITTHVGKNPFTISNEDKKVLAKWINISAGLLLDEETGAKLSNSILAN